MVAHSIEGEVKNTTGNMEGLSDRPWPSLNPYTLDIQKRSLLDPQSSPTCRGKRFIETNLSSMEYVSGNNGSTTYKMTPVVQRCPDCALWAAILPFLKVAMLQPDDAPEDFRIIDFYTPDNQQAPAASLTTKDFKRLKEFVQSVTIKQ